ncbi:MAG: hypothetical protein LAT54_03255 [Cryomorphaceae bacterium]|nr:hypothetical protein [Cryomorphaceae bacterium]
MKTPKYAAIFIMLFFFFSNGCQRQKCEGYIEGCGCPPSDFNPQVAVENIGLMNINRMSLRSSEVYNEGDEIKKNEHLSISFFTNMNRVSYVPKKSFSVFQSAYACSFAVSFRSDHVFRGISITSHADFDDDHPAGENLVDYFNSPMYPEKNAEDALKKHFDQLMFNQTTRLNIHQRPTASASHRFTISFLIDDETFTVQTPEVTFEM